MRSFDIPVLSRPKRPLADYVHALTPRLRRMARFYARRAGQDADDLLQEAWIGLIGAWEQLDESIGQPEQFLLRHARWRLLSFARRENGRRMLPIACEPNAPDGGNAAMRLDAADAIERMPLVHRRIVGCLQQQMTWREVGAQLGCTSANVAYHMRQIRSRLSSLAG